MLSWRPTPLAFSARPPWEASQQSEGQIKLAIELGSSALAVLNAAYCMRAVHEPIPESLARAERCVGAAERVSFDDEGWGARFRPAPQGLLLFITLSKSFLEITLSKSFLEK